MSTHGYTHPHHPDNWTRDEKKELLTQMILNAYVEQKNPRRDEALIPGLPFEVRTNQIDARMDLTNALQRTEALELLAEMVGAIDEEE